MKSIKKILMLSLIALALACGESQNSNQLSERQNKTEATADECCKICRKGKACGDSCINKKLKCHKAPGCACDG